MGEISSKPVDSNNLKLNLISGRKRAQIEQQGLINKNKKQKLEIAKQASKNQDQEAKNLCKEVLENQTNILRIEVLLHLTDIVLQQVKNKYFENQEDFQHIEQTSKFHAFLQCVDRHENKDLRKFQDEIVQLKGEQYVNIATNNDDKIIDDIIIKTFNDYNVTESEILSLYGQFKTLQPDDIQKWKQDQMKAEIKSIKLQNNFQSFQNDVTNNQITGQQIVNEINNINIPLSNQDMMEINNEVKLVNQDQKLNNDQMIDQHFNVSGNEQKSKPNQKVPDQKVTDQKVPEQKIVDMKHEPEKQVNEMINEPEINDNANQTESKISLDDLVVEDADKFESELEKRLNNIKKDAFMDDLESRLLNLK